MNELQKVEGTNKNISKQQGQESACSIVTWQHATGKGSSIEQSNLLKMAAQNELT